MIGIIGGIAHHLRDGQAIDQVRGFEDVMALSGGEQTANRQA